MSKTLNILMLIVCSFIGSSLLASTELKNVNGKIIKSSESHCTNFFHQGPPTPPYGATGY